MIPRRTLISAGCASLLLASVVSLSATIGVAPAAASPPATYVATSGVNSPSCGSMHQPCQTISYALGLTQAGGTIEVAPGTYNEQLVISRPVSIIGAGPAQTVIEPSSLPTTAADTDSNIPELAVVDVTAGTMWASLQGLTIDGSAASTQFSGCGQDFVGIYYQDASGSLDDVDVTNIELPTALFGCQDGQGIYVATDSGSATPSNVTMSDVFVNSYDKNGITCDDIGTICSIENSQVTGIGPTPLIAQNGIQIWGSSASIVNDMVSGNSYTNPYYPSDFYSAVGILVINASGLTVTGNRISANDDNVYALEDASYTPQGTPRNWVISNNDASDAISNPAVPFGNGLGDGIDVDSTSTSVSVNNNTVTNDPEFGIALYGVSNASVGANNAHDDGDGLYVGGPGSVGTTSEHDSIDFNVATNDQTDGIFADTDTSADSFMGNFATGAGTSDVVDSSTGSGTAGTANTWIGTTCVSSTPNGLCSSNFHRGFPLPPHHIVPPRFPFWHGPHGFHR